MQPMQQQANASTTLLYIVAGSEFVGLTRLAGRHVHVVHPWNQSQLAFLHQTIPEGYIEIHQPHQFPKAKTILALNGNLAIKIRRQDTGWNGGESILYREVQLYVPQGQWYATDTMSGKEGTHRRSANIKPGSQLSGSTSRAPVHASKTARIDKVSPGWLCCKSYASVLIRVVCKWLARRHYLTHMCVCRTQFKQNLHQLWLLPRSHLKMAMKTTMKATTSRAATREEGPEHLQPAALPQLTNLKDRCLVARGKQPRRPRYSRLEGWVLAAHAVGLVPVCCWLFIKWLARCLTHVFFCTQRKIQKRKAADGGSQGETSQDDEYGDEDEDSQVRRPTAAGSVQKQLNGSGRRVEDNRQRGAGGGSSSGGQTTDARAPGYVGRRGLNQDGGLWGEDDEPVVQSKKQKRAGVPREKSSARHDEAEVLEDQVQQLISKLTGESSQRPGSSRQSGSDDSTAIALLTSLLGKVAQNMRSPSPAKRTNDREDDDSEYESSPGSSQRKARKGSQGKKCEATIPINLDDVREQDKACAALWVAVCNWNHAHKE
jgi:hypothetical protein